MNIFEGYGFVFAYCVCIPTYIHFGHANTNTRFLFSTHTTAEQILGHGEAGTVLKSM